MCILSPSLPLTRCGGEDCSDVCSIVMYNIFHYLSMPLRADVFRMDRRLHTLAQQHQQW